MRGRGDGDAEFWTPDLPWPASDAPSPASAAPWPGPDAPYQPAGPAPLALTQPQSLPPVPPPRRRHGRAWFGLAVVVVAALALAGVGVVVLDLDKRADTSGDVVLRPVSTPGDNPFTSPVGRDVPQARAADRLGGAQPAPAGAPGRYAGSRDTAECGKEQLVDYLDANPVVAAAWTRVLGVAATGFGAYADTLTPVVLRYDTLVTDHTLAGGAAAPAVAVLQAGTAVLVDGRGLPVTRCVSGNPLTPGAAAAGATYSGPLWSGFAADAVVRTEPTAEPVRTFVLTDLDSGGLFSRPAGTTGTDDRDFQPVSEVDFLNTSYDVGCGGSDGPVTVTVTSGKGSSVAANAGVRRVEVVDLATADFTGDDAVETAVLLRCEPEDADYVVTEIQVFGDGPALLTTLTPPPAPAPLVLPLFTGDTFEASGGRLRTSARYYDFGAGDTLRSGPSVTTVVTWSWDGQRFTPDLGATTTASPSPSSSSSAPGSPSPSPTASGTPGADDCLPDDFVANWQGTLTRRVGAATVQSQTTLTLSDGCVGDVVGSTYYLELGCGGALTLASGGARPVFDERTTTPGSSCAASTELRARLSDGDLRVAYVESGGSPTSAGTLQRR